MSRLVKKPGDILQFQLSEPGRFGYAQWLSDDSARFFLYGGPELDLEQVVQLPSAFRVLVFKDTPGRYGWSKLGKAEIPPEFSTPQRYVMKDILTGQLSVYFAPGDGSYDQSPANPEEVEGLETMAAWAHPHVVERLESQLSGRPSAFLRGVSVEG